MKLQSSFLKERTTILRVIKFSLFLFSASLIGYAYLISSSSSLEEERENGIYISKQDMNSFEKEKRENMGDGNKDRVATTHVSSLFKEEKANEVDSFPVFPIEQYIKTVWCYPRPDNSKKMRLYITVPKWGLKEEIQLGKKIYIASDKSQFFSHVPTPFWITVEKESQDKLSIDVFVSGMRRNSFKNEPKDELFSYVSQLKKRDFYTELKEAKFFGKDLLHDLFLQEKKEAFRSFSPLSTLIFEGKNRYRLLLQEEDLLIFKEGIWRVIRDVKEAKGYPLAIAKRVTDTNILFYLWDEEGDHRLLISLERKRALPFQKDPRNLFSKVMKRGKRRISLEVEKRHWIVNEGDILYFKAPRFRLMKKPNLSSLLNREFEGDIFYFSKIEGGKMVGYLCNASHTKVERVECRMENRVFSQEKRVPINRTDRRENLNRMPSEREDLWNLKREEKEEKNLPSEERKVPERGIDRSTKSLEKRIKSLKKLTQGEYGNERK